VNADGSSMVALTRAQGGAATQHAPAWSPRQPDGSYRIAYSQQLMSVVRAGVRSGDTVLV
jgi:hypothetical protein